MPQMLSSDVLRDLIAAEGRYIQWEWDPQTLQNDYITLREASGHPVVGRDKNGSEFSLRLVRDVVHRLVAEHSVYEDESRGAPGFRIYRPTEEGRSRCDLRKAS
ncbi:MAG: hypothetical protein WBX25_13745 [Rhodomicrobium sp.]